MDRHIEELISNREKFDSFVYTPLDKALQQLSERKEDSKIISYLENKLPVPVPSVLQNKNSAVVFVQIATPNLELTRFISIVDAIEGLKPIFFEFTADKFTDNNEWKHSLGKMTFYFGRGKKGGEKTERLNVIDFNSSKGIKLSEVKTLWGQGLADFHHELFELHYPKSGRGKDITFFEGSDWFKQAGGHPQQYYEHFFRLFLSHGILFENYMLSEKEEWFTKNIVLPALLKINDEIGIKPLIVNVQPTEIEGMPFWTYHTADSIEFVRSKLSLV